MMKIWSMALVAMMVMVHADADARRMSGGKSVGKQSSNVTQRESATPPPAAPGAPAQNVNSAAAAKPGAAAAAPAAAAKKPWGAMLGGLAAGLGLAWLAHSLGLGAGFGQFLLIALLALGAFAVFRMFMRSRKPAESGTGNSPFAFQGAGAGAGATSPAEAQMPRQYSPQNVGNDASARPFERSSMAFDASRQSGGGSGVVIGSALAGSQNWGVPEGFDTEGFLNAAKRNFITLQGAWDRSDIAALRSMMTDSMVDEIRTQLSERESLRGASQPNHTDVVMLEAQLLGIEDLGDGYMASVEFSGMIREELSAGPSPFREVWNMTKAKTGNSGWLVAGVQALQ
ncbi:Tim44 domain-containing protein [Paracidovorax valerianellae]|uniref:Predicted lipid-binding transport protein, Tim44 family n=1 Tax=Paracidovorax valerianellae TaxID=187868 RepID=A0A1G6NYU5_9BURK|nr:Tim44-like domain-containing protein [Paracidovorax valerianellae]MDA8444687.1 Tim44-like domain-containing protein [Paracidovorax valerianellae]SDC73200.1 Predicted lipid-binding transport protein, Tim44 family [Paracidovorax valerianellae]